MIANPGRIDPTESGPHLSDTQLMVRVREGDVQAFDELMLRHEQRVIGMITKGMGSHSHAEDLAQQVFLRVFRARETYVPSAKFSTWLFTITQNVVLNARRQLSRQRDAMIVSWSEVGRQQHIEDKLSSELDPLASAMRVEEQQAVRKAIGQLNAPQQEAVRLVCLRGYCYQAAAVQMDVTENAVRSLLHRAKGNLRQLLEPCFGHEG